MSIKSIAQNNGRFSNFLSISIFALAASIGYFTFELSQFIRQIPDILENVRTTSEKIEPTLKEISQVRELVLPILTEVKAIRELTPSILNESEAIREQVSAALQETKKVRSNIPAILSETAALREQLPAALSSANQASASVVLISAELKAYQPIATEALKQIDGTRKEIPEILNRTDAMIDRARIAAREASSGVVTGALGGLLTAPFRLIGDFGSKVLDLSSSEAKDYSKEDLETLKEMSIYILQNGVINETKSWNNTKTGRQSKITLQKELIINNQTCREILINSWLNSKLTLNKTITACINEDGEWEDQD